MARVSRILLVLLVLCSACPRERDENGTKASYEAISLDGTTVSLDALRGRVVLLNVWTLWCPPCRAEMSVLERLHRDYRPAGLALVGVNIDGRMDLPAVRSFLRQAGLTFDVWLDPDDAVSRRFPTPSLPATYLIARDGRIVWSRLGVVHPDDPELGTALRNTLRAEQLARAPGEPSS